MFINIINVSSLKRPLPSSSLIKWRERYLAKLKELRPVYPNSMQPTGLSAGNNKTGKMGALYKSVLLWNLPSVATCPGASAWCIRHCYNADPRELVFPIEDWRENWWWVTNCPEILHNKIMDQISVVTKPCAIRIHSSGDFFSESYINFWISIASTAKDIVWWAYTRSWSQGSLISSLESFRSLSNVQLFASWDKTMPEPPKGWRRSTIIDGANVNHYKVSLNEFICPEQFGMVTNCASCGFCMRNVDNGDVLFYPH